MNPLRLDRLDFALVWPWKAPRRSIRSKEAMELLTGLCCMTQTRVRSGVVAKLIRFLRKALQASGRSSKERISAWD